MTTQIGLISDVHATPEPVREALEYFRNEGIDEILCAGDIAGYGDDVEGTVELLRESGCRSIYGNHDLWWLSRAGHGKRGPVAAYLGDLRRRFDLTVEDKRIVMVHASPPGSILKGMRLLDEGGSLMPAAMALWRKKLASFGGDVLVVGHTHQVFCVQLGDVLVINPGSTKFNHTCAVLTLPDLDVRIVPLGDRDPVKAWNWSREVAGDES